MTTDLKRELTLYEAKLSFDEKGALTFNQDDRQKDYSEDLILRLEGLQRAIYNHYIVSKIIGDGTAKGQYIDLKRKDLAKIIDNLKQLFLMEYKRQTETGISLENAKKKALSAVGEYKQKCLKQHYKQFPDNISHGELMKMLTIEKTK